MPRFAHIGVLCCCFLLLSVTPARAKETKPVNPFPRPLYVGEALHTFPLEQPAFSASGGGGAGVQKHGPLLRVMVPEGCHDPMLILPPLSLTEAGDMLVTFRMRATGGGRGEIFWSEQGQPGFRAEQASTFNVTYDNEWREYRVLISTAKPLARLRIDPSTESGVVEFSEIAVRRGGLHPLEIVAVRSTNDCVEADLMNHAEKAVTYTYLGTTADVPAGQTVTLVHRLPEEGADTAAVRSVEIHIDSPGLTPISRVVSHYRDGKIPDPISIAKDALKVDVANDGTLAQIFLEGKLVAILAPISATGGEILRWKIESVYDGHLSFSNERGSGKLGIDNMGLLYCRFSSAEPLEGPMLRVVGSLEQGVFPGLEYLGKGEPSSSTADIHTAQHLRYEPPIEHITWPMIACVTDRVSAALFWSNRDLQPTFASPNFIDGAPDHRMSLKGKEIAAAIRIAPPAPITETIAWAWTRPKSKAVVPSVSRRLHLKQVREPDDTDAIKRLREQLKRVEYIGQARVHSYRNLPTPGPPPRTPEDQDRLCLAALQGPLRTADGWGHCTEEKWERRWYATLATTQWRLTGQMPVMPELVFGGAHIDDERSFLLTERGKEWLAGKRNQVQHLLKLQQPDGSFLYTGKYLEGHFENTASGHCARAALTLLRYAEATGDAEFLTAGLRTLKYMQRFRTPRGAQVWELSLHTPDILAAGYAVKANMIAHRLTGFIPWRAEARRWALSGLPFIYLWGDLPVMHYATIPVYGATNWKAPHWIGLPVQWCGLVYADALVDLAEHDQTLDWRKIAQGILVAGQQMQYPDGPNIGCFPDIFELKSQRRAGPSINPTSLVILDDRLQGKPSGLQTLKFKDRHIVSPYRLKVSGKAVLVDSQPDQQYQLIVNGRIVDRVGRPEDVFIVEHEGDQ